MNATQEANRRLRTAIEIVFGKEGRKRVEMAVECLVWEHAMGYQSAVDDSGAEQPDVPDEAWKPHLEKYEEFMQELVTADAANDTPDRR